MKQYDPSVIEPKWQAVWEDTKLYEVKDFAGKKINASPMLPYPSGSGLHVGHVRNYTIADTIARFYRQRGHSVMSNIGWDAFGLPAENYAIKTGTPPWESVATNIENFTKQLKRLGMSYDWSRQINTSDPEYYRWTQWIFLQLFKKDLAYQAESWQWWCNECKTVLADEQVVEGACWRHEESKVTKKRLKQWFFKITDYADRLLEATDDLDWPANIKTMQKNWIGKSEGAEITFAIHGQEETIKVFTTRQDTIFGATFIVLAPEHPLVEKVSQGDQVEQVTQYVIEAQKIDSVKRLDTNRPKTGVFTGSYAINPVTNKEIPIWVADYVLMDYGTGAIMAVPAHDQRDWEFATKFDLPIVKVFDTDDDTDGKPTAGEGKVIDPGKYHGLATEAVREKILVDIPEIKAKTNYKIHDWLISRQRYWGAPIPIIHCDACGAVAVEEEDLPVVLPKVKNFTPTGGEKSVLASVDSWVNVKCPSCGKPAKRETDTMDGYACSSWYMLRYADPHNDKMAWDKEKVDYWFPVDFYFGGDHAVSHLLYFRFWMYFFADIGLVEKGKAEPIKRLVYNGYINAQDGTKMSKSKGNVVDPLEIIDSGYGADALRLFELFIAPYDQDTSWNTAGVPGTYRFLQKVWNLVSDFIDSQEQYIPNAEQETLLLRSLNKTIKKITDDLEGLNFNTAVSSMMEFMNSAIKIRQEMPVSRKNPVWNEAISSFLQLLAPFAPHLTEELWHEIGNDDSIHFGHWPVWDEKLIVEDIITIVVQVNGKVRASLEVDAKITDDEMVKTAKANPKVLSYLQGEPKKTVVVSKKLVSFVV